MFQSKLKSKLPPLIIPASKLVVTIIMGMFRLLVYADYLGLLLILTGYPD